MRHTSEPIPPEIAVVQAGPEQQMLLRRLMELCQHDYSEFDDAEVDEEGRFGYRL